jgi:L-fucose isomerase-like protein
MEHATKVSGPTRQDVLNGVKSFHIARTIMEREEGDGITMDCLGALGRTEVSLPCIAWSRMLDHGVPAACEADIGAALTHAVVQFLFDRPGFEQDPVPETAKDCLIGAHCTCPTRLRGFSQPPEPYSLSHHHGMRDAVPLPVWRIGQRITVADIVPGGEKPRMFISAGEVVENVSVPPSGGCVVSVMVKLDGVTDLLAYPGFHQLFFYGDFKKELRGYCQLFGIAADVV